MHGFISKLCIVLLLPLAACSKESSDKDVLIVGTNAEYPPYTFLKDREVVGFDIDVAKQVCDNLGKGMTIRNVPFDSLISDLVLHKVDFVAAGLTPTAERARKVTFVKPHYSNDNLVVVTIKDGITDIQGLCGRSVVVNEGYTADLYMSQFNEIKILRLPAPADAFMALNTNRVDAFVTSKVTFDDFKATHPSCAYKFFYLTDSGTEDISMAVSKNNNALKAEIEAALEQMEVDGTLSALRNKWGLS